MKYRDNEVQFTIYGAYSEYTTVDYEVGDGYFKIDKFSISSGQDPDGKIKSDKYSISKGLVSFSIGRHKTKEVAKWFNDVVSAKHTTFGHTAGELNFAMIGELSLEIKEKCGHAAKTFTFKNIALAQGHAGASNNWWFGCLDSEGEASTTTIACDGVCSDGSTIRLFFKRGGAAEPNSQSVNEIEIFYPPRK